MTPRQHMRDYINMLMRKLTVENLYQDFPRSTYLYIGTYCRGISTIFYCVSTSFQRRVTRHSFRQLIAHSTLLDRQFLMAVR